MKNVKEAAITKLEERGVTINDIATIVYNIQGSYQNITVDDCKEMVLSIISKRETLYTILTGIAIDEIAEKGLFDPEINKIITDDNSLYGLDEILALSIVNMNGSIALTNFGYLDKTKPGIIGQLDKEGKSSTKCHTFLDDIICAIAASAASRIAHQVIKK
ncbi:MAG: phosphatidylglycerophosphatase A [Bacilli bacterium]|nr:phosphatidylglycerophosphatase A [Bacilli bacterium]MDD4643463.1 phosphatidylglycerophosphatase A [Bacilli bacterium]